MKLNTINYIIITILLLAVSCSEDNEPKYSDDEQIVKEGMEMYTRATASGSYAPHSHMNKIEISYGDKSCITFKSTLAFDVYGFDGYHERFWQK